MSLINDALKRASQTPPPRIAEGGEMQPVVEAKPAITPLLIIAVCAALLLSVGCFFVLKGIQRYQARSAQSVAARPFPSTSPVPRVANTTEAPKPPAQVAPAPQLAAEASKPAAVVPPATPPPPVSRPAAVPLPDRSKAGSLKFKLQGIFYRTNKPSVLINGRTFFIGDRLDTAIIKAINPTSVTIEQDGETRLLTLH
jgi:hypothetical protein